MAKPEFEKIALEIAQEANTCCNRSDGFEQQIKDFVLSAIFAAYEQGLKQGRDERLKFKTGDIPGKFTVPRPEQSYDVVIMGGGNKQESKPQRLSDEELKDRSQDYYQWNKHDRNDFREEIKLAFYHGYRSAEDKLLGKQNEI